MKKIGNITDNKYIINFTIVPKLFPKLNSIKFIAIPTNCVINK